jgi:Gnt-I system high-affinity gluconate transporter
MNLLILFAAIAVLLLLILQFKLNAFLALMLTALGTGLALGMPVDAVIKSVEKGVGSTLGQLALVIGFGAMLGEILAQSGAIQQVSTRLIDFFGEKYIQWAILLSAFVVGIPMFYNAAFVILIPIVYSLAKTTKLPLLYLGIPMTAALSVTHGYLPPHPGPTAICNLYKADMIKVMFYGIIVAIPAVIAGGILTGNLMKKMDVKIPALFQNNGELSTRTLTLPPLSISVLVALSPLLFMAIGSVLKITTHNNWLVNIGTFIGDPSVSLLLAVLLATYFLGIKQGKTMTELGDSVSNAVKPAAMILLVIGGGGAFKQVLVDSGVGKEIGDAMMTLPISPLILAWAITATLRVCLGSATVAGLTAAGLIAPLADSSGVSRELLTLATGAGSIFFSNVNDTGFWMFKEYFGTTVGQTFRSWSVMEALVSSVGLAGVLLLSLFV